jgi:pyrimidine oxygenase
MILMSALAQHTSRIKVWCTVHTLLHNPAVAAKMVATLDHVSHGRAGMNIVSGSYHDEFEQMGTWRDDFDHDGRYDYAGEWIAAVKRLWTEPRVDFDGKYFKLTDCVSDPKPVSKPGPTLICAGISDIGLRLTAKYADAAFVFGKDEAEIGARSRRAKELGAEYGRAISTLTYCTVISGATDEEAEERVQHYRAGQDHGTVDGMADAYSHNPRQDGKANTLVLHGQGDIHDARLVRFARDPASKNRRHHTRRRSGRHDVHFPRLYRRPEIFRRTSVAGIAPGLRMIAHPLFQVN